MIIAFDPLKIQKRSLSSDFPLIQYGDSFCVCGQPQKADLEELKKEKWDLILNLRNPEEMSALDFKMEELCEILGLDYQIIPILQESVLNKEALKKINTLIKSGDYKKIVIHCAVGGRAVLALIACFVLSKECQLEDVPEIASHFGFQSPQMINNLMQALI